MAKSRTERILEECPLFAWSGPGHCGGCDKPLGSARRRWCSDACTKSFLQQHSWQDARAAAIKRDGGCVHCGRDGMVPQEMRQQIGFLRHLLIDLHPHRYTFREWCREAIQADPERFKWMPWKSRHSTMIKEFKKETGIEFEHQRDAFERLANRAILNYSLEVNHIAPIKGRHAEYGCLHHLAGLETLCGQCHIEETRQQRARGEFR